MKSIKCSYCKGDAILVDSSVIYGRSYGDIYLCSPCDAYVGVHKGTTKPKGTPANKALRELRKDAHEAFDFLTWKQRTPPTTRKGRQYQNKLRSRAYTWLGMKMGIKNPHIGEMNLEGCQKVIDLCVKEMEE